MKAKEFNALERLNNKMGYMAGLITLMVKTKTNQRTLAALAGVEYEHVRKMIRTPAHGSLDQWEHLLTVMQKEYEKL
ncbi:hypothetical protein [Klebsiella quasivariicola]|uniref:hypothetical protein n=1 Tax=Klebsiella quasivariicola TaxID=2026240 RepID=UPI0024787900|nr:hypothetical protein [Klebsiella quasivariicola]